jgi:hypothetical protein
MKAMARRAVGVLLSLAMTATLLAPMGALTPAALAEDTVIDTAADYTGTEVLINNNNTPNNTVVTITQNGDGTFSVGGVSGVSNPYANDSNYVHANGITGARRIVVKGTDATPVNIVLEDITLSNSANSPIALEGSAYAKFILV